MPPAHRQQLGPDTALNPHDHHHRGELTLERQHHDDHQGSSRTRARRTPAMPPTLRTSGSRTSPASPPLLEPRLELLQTEMEEREGEGEARPGVRKKEHRDHFIARDRCTVGEVHQHRSSLDRRCSEANPRAVPTSRWPAR